MGVAADLALVAVYLLALLVLARRRRKSSAGEYLLAGRSLTLPAFVATLVSTWYGGVLGVGEYSYLHGLSNWLALGGPYYLAGLVFAFLLAGRVRRSDLVTVPDRLLEDHGPGVAALGSVLVFVNMLPAAYLLMLGVLAHRLLGIPATLGVVLFAALSVALVAGAGFRTVVRHNGLQFVLMYGCFALLLPVALVRAGGVGAFSTLPAEVLSWDGGMGLQAVVVWYVIALQTLVEPSFYQRCYAARTPTVARRGIIWSVLFWIVFDGLTTLTGMLARVLLPGLSDPVEAYPALADALLPPVARGLFYVGLLATVMSTVESYLFVAAGTVGFDLPRIWRRWRGETDAGRHSDERATARATRAGLIVATAASVALALSTTSVVTLWKAVGSVITPALLLPLLGGFWPRWRAGSRATGLSILLAATTALSWMAPTWWGHAPPFEVEPIFPALAVSIAIHLPAWLRPRGRFGPRSEPARPEDRRRGSGPKSRI